MNNLRNMPAAGFVVIVIIAALSVLALILLVHTFLRYKWMIGKTGGSEEAKGFRAALLKSYIEAYKRYGQDVNTPAIITDTIAKRLSGLLFCERFLNNAVSLFVTLGLFGTFLGLSMSVSSLTQLIGYSNTGEWLSVLDSVGGGLLSALSGMGVAFYTSLFGAGCSIILTILRTVLSPQAERERLETRLELWLDTEIAPTLSTEAIQDESRLLKSLIDTLNASVGEMKNTLNTAAEGYVAATRTAAVSLSKTIENSREVVQSFDKTVGTFNEGVHDFAEVDYNLRGSVERMDLAVRDLANALREINRRMGAGAAK